MAFLIIPFILIWGYSHRRLRLIKSFFISFLILFSLSLLFIPNWLAQMLEQIMEYPSYTARIGSLTSTIASYFPSFGVSLDIILQMVFFLYLIVEWGLAWKKDGQWFLWTAMLTLVITNFLAVRTATTNYVMLLPVLLLIFSVWIREWGVLGNWSVGAGLFLLLSGLWFLFVFTVVEREEQAIMYLPLPIICLFGILWMRSRFITGNAFL